MQPDKMVRWAWMLAFCSVLGALGQVRINEICATASDRVIRWDEEGRAHIGSGMDWYEPEFDASDWSNGAGPIGMGLDAQEDLSSQMRSSTPSFYMRQPFSASQVQADSTNALVLEVVYTDGFVAYLNGKEIARKNAGAPGAPMMHDQPAFNGAARFITGFGNTVWTNTIDLGASLSLLRAGTNVLAVQSHNNDTDFLDAILQCKTVLKTASGEVLADYNGNWDWFVGVHEPSGGVVEPIETNPRPSLELWVEPDFDDSAWSSGPGGIGFGDGDDGTDIQADMRYNASTLYLRLDFEVQNTNGTLVLSVDYDDGFVAYLNGKEVARRNGGSTGSFVPYDAFATSGHEAGTPVVLELGAVADFVHAGTNLLAFQVLNVSLNSSDLTLNANLYVQDGASLVVPADTWRYLIGTEEPVQTPEEEPAEDVDSGFLDWIELENHGTQPVPLAGWSLTDSASKPAKWVFPDIVLPAGKRLVVACSDADVRDPSASLLHTGFKLGREGEYVGLYNTEGTAVSEIAPGYPEQHLFHSYGWDATAGDYRFFSSPTPGQANTGATYSVFPDSPDIMVDSGFYDGTTNVSISTSLAGASIYYTTNGSVPSASSGTLYSAPVPVTSTAVLRAVVVSADGATSDPATRSLVMNAPEALKSLPAISMVGPPTRAFFDPYGVVTISGGRWVGGKWQPVVPDDYNIPIMYGRPFERRICFEMFAAGSNAWSQVDCGVRVVASSWSRAKLTFQDMDGEWYAHPHSNKAQFNIFCRGVYGDDAFKNRLIRESPLDKIAQLRIRSGKNDWKNPFVRDELMRRLYADMGQVSSTGVLAGLWVNGIFRCFYNPVERYGEPFYQARFESDMEWDAVSHDANNSERYSLNDGDDVAWLEMYDFFAANDTSELENYQTLTDMVDPENFADYMLVNMYGATTDWAGNNWHASRERSINGRFRFHVWDAESALNQALSYNVIAKKLQGNTPIGNLYRALAASPEFAIQMQDRLAEHFFYGGCMEDAAIQLRFDALADRLDPMMQYVHGALVSRSKINTWIAGRRPYFLQQMRDAGFWHDLDRPEIAPFGGDFSDQVIVSLSTTNAGATVFYALDGLDPRAPGGGVQGEAYTGPFKLLRSNTVKARIFNDGIWGPLAQAVFFGQDTDLLVSEIHFHPEGPDGGDYEFVELRNTGTQPLNLNGYALDGGIDFAFPEVVVPTGGYLVVARDLSAFTNRYDTNGLHIAGQYSGELANGGEDIRLEYAGQKLFDIIYSDARGWPPAADGGGPSLVLVNDDDVAQGFDIFDHPSSWRASTYNGGSPGRTDPDPPPSLLIGEVIAHTDTGQAPPFDSNDKLELHNPTDAVITLDANWHLGDDVEDPLGWNIPEGTIIPAKGWVVFDEDDFHPGRTSGFGLDKAGEQVVLSHRPGGGMDRVVDCVEFKGQANGASWGRYPDADAYFQTLEPTPGTTNRLPSIPSIRIAEVMYNPRPLEGFNADEVLEYILLTNRSSQAVVLVGEAITNTWRINSAVDYTFASGTSMAAGEQLWLVPFDPATEGGKKQTFCQTYGLDAATVRLLGPYSGDLSNGGERLALECPQASDDISKPDDISWIIIDEATWVDEAPWPEAADGMGVPIRRNGSAGNDPHSWQIPYDFDADGLPDEWELDRRPVLDDFGSGDFDGDGQGDWAEYIAGTDLTRSSSLFELDVGKSGALGYELEWHSVSGRVYSVLWSSNLYSEFTPIAESVEYPRNSYTDQIYNAREAGFYRIGVWTHSTSD